MTNRSPAPNAARCPSSIPAWVAGAWVALGVACGTAETRAPEPTGADAGPNRPDVPSIACLVEGPDAVDAGALTAAPGQSAGVFDGLARATLQGSRLTITYAAGAIVSLEATGALAARYPVNQPLLTHVEIEPGGSSVIVSLRIEGGLNAGALRYAAWDSSAALPDVSPYRLSYTPSNCDYGSTACGVRVPQLLTVTYDGVSQRLSTGRAGRAATANVANGDSSFPITQDCADAGPRLRGWLSEDLPPVGETCPPEGTPNAGLVRLESAALGTPGDTRAEGIAAVSTPGPEQVELAFEDGRTFTLRAGDDTHRAVPAGRWRTQLSLRSDGFTPYALLTLRALDGPEPGALRFAAWSSTGQLPDVAPFTLSHREESCGVRDLGGCAIVAPQTLIVGHAGQTTAVSSGFVQSFEGATIRNGDSYHLVGTRCTDQTPRVNGLLTVP